MRTFKIKAHFTNEGFEIVEIQGKNLGEAFNTYFKRKAKNFVQVIGFILISEIVSLTHK